LLKRIILTSNYSPWSSYSGGGQRSTHHLAEEFLDSGFDVHVVYTKTIGEDVPVPRNLPYKIHWGSYPGMLSNRKNWFRPLSIFSVQRKVKNLLIPGTVIHSNGEEGALLRTQKNELVKFVVTPRYPHIPDDVHSLYADSLAFLKRPGLSKYLLLYKALSKADAITPTSRFAEEMIKKAYDLSNKTYYVVPNGVPEVFTEETSHESTAKRTVLFFGRLSKEKGIDLFLEACEIAHTYIDEIIIIGRGEFEPEIRKRNKMGQLSGKITLLPWMEIEKLAVQIRNASVALLPSREESFGNAIAEAMACGTPVITSGAGSIPEIILNEEEGIVIQNEDYAAMGEALIELLSNPEKRKDMGDAARERIINTFTWKKTASRFLEIYQTLFS